MGYVQYFIYTYCKENATALLVKAIPMILQ